MGAQQSKKFVLSFIEHLSAGDVDAVMAAFTDDVTWWLPGSLPVSGTFKGKQAILEDFFGKAFPFFEPGSLANILNGDAADSACPRSGFAVPLVRNEGSLSFC